MIVESKNQTSTNESPEALTSGVHAYAAAPRLLGFHHVAEDLGTGR
jgi:hypothetical protein